MVKQLVVQYANKRKPNGKQMTSLVEIDAREDDTNKSIIEEVILAMQQQGESCVRCFVIEK